ncbi:uncharacterized protein LOC114589642 [Podarcis muralis]
MRELKDCEQGSPYKAPSMGATTGPCSFFWLLNSSGRMSETNPANLARMEGGRWMVDLVRLSPASLPTPSEHSLPGTSETSGPSSLLWLLASSGRMKETDPANLARMEGGRWTVDLVRLSPAPLLSTSERSLPGTSERSR